MRRHWSCALELQVEPEPLIGTKPAAAPALGASTDSVAPATTIAASNATMRHPPEPGWPRLGPMLAVMIVIPSAL